MRRWLALVLTATTSLVVISLLIPLAYATRAIPRARAVSEARLSAYSLIRIIASVNDEATIKQKVAEQSIISGTQYSLLLPNGKTIGPTIGNEAKFQEARQGTAVSYRSPSGVVLLVPAVMDSGTAVVGVAVPETKLSAGVANAWIILAALGLGMILIAVVVADRLARSMTRPIAGLAATTRALVQGDLSARVKPAGPPEIADVGNTLNLLADRINELLLSEREAVADLSHRLRTPITALRLNAEGLQDPTEAARICVDVDALSRSVDELIRQARSPINHGPSITDAIEIVSARTEYWGALAEEQDRKVETAFVEGPAWVGVQEDELVAAIDILIDNIFTHTPENTAFRVSVVADDETVTIRFDDAGPGLHRDLKRGESPGGSTGLGISIARKTAEEAEGTLTLEKSPLGGLRVNFAFPRMFHHSSVLNAPLRPRVKTIAR